MLSCWLSCRHVFIGHGNNEHLDTDTAHGTNNTEHSMTREHLGHATNMLVDGISTL